MSEHEIHEYCDIFPDLDEAELKQLAADIEKNGQRVPIYRWNKKILDGKNRLKACQLAGVVPIIEPWFPSKPDDATAADNEAWEFCKSLNYNRRHLTASQRSVFAAKEVERANRSANLQTPSGTSANLHSGDDSANLHTHITAKQAAEKHGVSVRSVNSAKKVLANGSPELQHAVTNGHVTVSDAANIADEPKPKQDAAVKAVTNGHAKTVTEAVQREPGDETENERKPPKKKKAAIPNASLIQPAADSVTEFNSAIQACGKLREQIRAICEGPGGGKVARLWSDMQRMLEQISVNLKSYKFWAACPECKITDEQQKADSGCKLCRGHGWIAKTNGLSDIHKSWLRERGVEC